MMGVAATQPPFTSPHTHTATPTHVDVGIHSSPQPLEGFLVQRTPKGRGMRLASPPKSRASAFSIALVLLGWPPEPSRESSQTAMHNDGPLAHSGVGGPRASAPL
eukprot:CAMPEP_0174359624 /NCGR_PEP_ID=MMETSP0811_2-20130205/49713_1 /TAXON_ID=73025 ORGANISM="Eutreptiella gymnastica-like, Strain CCMP1594" /NCGR_SAMPLE_ID=MMETSP0811_2 /ASSEMBLY_ACC=CAM_ASM_000667 /LENGTH=104 /DNA_ID=CAMNT_0015494523 /DNA_START=362 /DNA_END=672 /DNA_ORIENTATION=-